MASQEGEPKRFYAPAYPLELVRELCDQGKVNFLGRQVQLDVAALDLDLEAVRACLRSLHEGEFDCSLLYEGTTARLDAYVVRRYPCPNGVTDLYVKFKVFGSVLQIQVSSFHKAKY